MPSFQLQAPSGLTDSEGESEDEGGREAAVESRRRPSLGAAGVRPLSPAEVALTELTTRLEAQLRVGGCTAGKLGGFSFWSGALQRGQSGMDCLLAAALLCLVAVQVPWSRALHCR
jgi:hypothetical protein